MVSQANFIKLKFKPSSHGLLLVSQSHTTYWNSSFEKLLVSNTMSWPLRLGKAILFKFIFSPRLLDNLFLKWVLTSSLSVIASPLYWYWILIPLIIFFIVLHLRVLRKIFSFHIPNFQPINSRFLFVDCF